jgi:hypothetical protein
MKHARYALLALSISTTLALLGCSNLMGGGDKNTGNAVTFHSNYTRFVTGATNDYSAIVRVPDDGTVGNLMPSAGTITNTNVKQPIVASFDIPANFQLKEWNTSADGKGAIFTATTSVGKSIDVYAIWESSAVATSTLPLVYDSAGGGDSSGVYTYDTGIALPISKPGTLKLGAKVAVKIDGESCYDLGNLTAQIVSSADHTIVASDAVAFDAIERGTPFLQTKDLTMTADLVCPAPGYVLLLKASNSVFTSQLGFAATITFTPADGAFVVLDQYSVALSTAKSTTVNLYGTDYSYMTVTTPSADGDPVKFVCASWAYYSQTTVTAGFVLPTNFDLSAYTKVDIKLSSDAAVKFAPMSNDFTSSSSSDTIKFSTTIGASNTSTSNAAADEIVELSGATLSSVKSLAFTIPVNKNFNIYSITFEK